MAKKTMAAVCLMIGLASALAIRAHGRDDDKKYAGTEVCEDINQNLAADQFSYTQCIEGHGCVVCTGDSSPLGVVANNTGLGQKLWMPRNSPCGGNRLVGVCTGAGPAFSNCDLSNAYMDGDCTGNMKSYQDQPINP